MSAVMAFPVTTFVRMSQVPSGAAVIVDFDWILTTTPANVSEKEPNALE